VKILHVDTGLEWRGGQQQVFYLHSILTRMGVQSNLICSARGALAARAARAGLPVTPMNLGGEFDLLSARKIAGMLNSGDVDLLHLHSSHAHGIGMAAAFMARFLKVVVTRRVDFRPKSHPLNRWKYGPGVARFVAISEIIRNILKEFGVPESRMRLVHSGVDPDRPRPGTGPAFRREFSIPEDSPLIGNIGALADHKGQRYLVEAAPMVLAARPDARFVIVGAGELMGELKSLAASLGLGDRLIFTGFRKDVEAALDAFDLFAMPSHMEGLGTAVLDAFAARRPVVAARGGGIPELIEDNVDGLLVEPKNPRALADAILRVLSEEGLGKTLAAAAREKVETKFSAQAMAEGNLAVYRELCF